MFGHADLVIAPSTCSDLTFVQYTQLDIVQYTQLDNLPILFSSPICGETNGESWTCDKSRLAFYFASLRHFDFLNCRPCNPNIERASQSTDISVSQMEEPCYDSIRPEYSGHGRIEMYLPLHFDNCFRHPTYFSRIYMCGGLETGIEHGFSLNSPIIV